MGLKIETWAIAYRKKKKELLLGDASGFSTIKNGHKGWYADPFLFDYEGKTYLFAEFFSYKLNRGIIVCSEYEEHLVKFSKYTPIIIENYHLSYPNVFELNNKIYMMPEANESNSLFVYEAVSFPYEWKKTKVFLEDVRLVDTTVFQDEDSFRAISMLIDDNNEKMIMFDIEKNSFEISNIQSITDDISIARPGGKVLNLNGELIFVTQDCKDEYGKAINFLRAKDTANSEVNLDLIKKINSNQISINNGKKPDGIHTYNFSDNLEVIDLKYYKVSFVRIIYRIMSKIKLH